VPGQGLLPDDLLAAAAFTLLLIACALVGALVLAEFTGRFRAASTGRAGTAEARSFALLRDWLSPAQRAQYARERQFDVVGSHTGKRYRIRCGQQMNVDEIDDEGAIVATWCFVPDRHVPIGDVLLAQKIALENNELATLAIANRCR
jgi:hypothetical protein